MWFTEETTDEPVTKEDDTAQKMEMLLQKHMMFLSYRKQITELIGTTVVK
jgi:hypothetical protein